MRYAAPLDEERSESRLATVLPQSGDYRGQRFMPLLGVGGLIGAAATEEENQAEQSFNHGKISVDTDYYERPRRSAGARTRAAA